MKILLLYTKDPKEVFNRKSAIGSYIHCLGSLLNTNDNEVYLNGERIEAQINVSPDQNASSGKKSVLFNYIPGFVKRGLKEYLHFKKLKNFKASLDQSNIVYDVIVEFYNIGSDIGTYLSDKYNCKLVTTYDGPIVEEYTFFNDGPPLFKRKIERLQKEALKKSDKIVVYSEPMRKFVKAITGDREGIEIHQNVDFTRFDVMKENKSQDDKTVNICFIGSFLKWHQVDLLVHAFENLLEKNCDANLYLVGDGVERSKIEAQVKTLKNAVKDKIHFTGFLDGEELFELKKKMHIGVMSGSNWYGAPNKIFEYGAMKMAVIAPDTPTIEFLFDQNEVKFFKWKDQQGLTDSLFTLSTNTELRNRFSNQLTTKIVEKYTEENTKRFYEDLIDSKA